MSSFESFLRNWIGVKGSLQRNRHMPIMHSLPQAPTQTRTHKPSSHLFSALFPRKLANVIINLMSICKVIVEGFIVLERLGHYLSGCRISHGLFCSSLFYLHATPVRCHDLHYITRDHSGSKAMSWSRQLFVIWQFRLSKLKYVYIQSFLEYLTVSPAIHFVLTQPIPETMIKECTIFFRPMHWRPSCTPLLFQELVDFL